MLEGSLSCGTRHGKTRVYSPPLPTFWAGTSKCPMDLSPVQCFWIVSMPFFPNVLEKIRFTHPCLTGRSGQPAQGMVGWSRGYLGTSTPRDKKKIWRCCRLSTVCFSRPFLGGQALVLLQGTYSLGQRVGAPKYLGGGLKGLVLHVL